MAMNWDDAICVAKAHFVGFLNQRDLGADSLELLALLFCFNPGEPPDLEEGKAWEIAFRMVQHMLIEQVQELIRDLPEEADASSLQAMGTLISTLEVPVEPSPEKPIAHAVRVDVLTLARIAAFSEMAMAIMQALRDAGEPVLVDTVLVKLDEIIIRAWQDMRLAEG